MGFWQVAWMILIYFNHQVSMIETWTGTTMRVRLFMRCKRIGHWVCLIPTSSGAVMFLMGMDQGYRLQIHCCLVTLESIKLFFSSAQSKIRNKQERHIQRAHMTFSLWLDFSVHWAEEFVFERIGLGAQDMCIGTTSSKSGTGSNNRWDPHRTFIHLLVHYWLQSKVARF
jgi:hypothetical protein